MKYSHLINNKRIYYTDIGQGVPVVLLHGYLESLEIWGDFAVELSKKFRVLSFDIPGHGNSDVLSEAHTLQALVEILKSALCNLNVEKCFMIGHSMGGYLTLLFHDLFPELLSGFCLFHSHPFADSEATIKKRLREIELVKDGKKDLIAKFNIPNAFSPNNLVQFEKEIQNATNIALQTTEKGIIANLHAMMNRPDLSESLVKSTIPFLYLVGEHDNYIDYNTVVPKVRHPKMAEQCVLSNSGHMGFIEEKELSLLYLERFINQFIK
ncbi:MAG TPA: alpha/beta hydrolase [Bacteroidales bacterium]|jgi:pimeloyl-ACP methyl ester carboxylesterase|nr:alpha/beta hydrolase [Bacteroidales bacterium]